MKQGIARNTVGDMFDRSRRKGNDHINSLNVPISESGRVAFATASNWGASISPALAEAIAKAVRENAGLPEDVSEKKPALGFVIKPL